MSSNSASPNTTQASWGLLSKQLNQAKLLLRRIRQTVEDIEDARTIERAKRAQGKNPRIPWSQLKKKPVWIDCGTSRSPGYKAPTRRCTGQTEAGERASIAL